MVDTVERFERGRGHTVTARDAPALLRSLVRERTRSHHLLEHLHDLQDVNETLLQQLRYSAAQSARAGKHASGRRHQLEQRIRSLELDHRLKARVSAGVVSELVSMLHVAASDLARLAQTGSKKQDGQWGGQLSSLDQVMARLLGRAADLRDLLRMETGASRPTRVLTDLNAFLKAVIERLDPRLEAERIKISMELAPELPEVWLDRPKIEAVVLHLLENAVRVTPRFGLVRLRTWKGDNMVAVSVSDDGPGILANRLEALAKFVSGTIDEKVAAEARPGLGMLLLRDVVQLHHGRTEINSEFGEGATFSLFLPLATPADHDARQSRGSSAKLPSSSRTSEFRVTGFALGKDHLGLGSSPEGRPTVLIVDPVPQNLYLLAIELHSMANVVTAGSSTEAKQRLETAIPKVIVCDLGLEGDSAGLALCQSLKGNPATAGIPFVMTADDPAPGTVRSALAQGADDFLPKPFHAAELRSRIGRWLPGPSKVS